MPNPKRKKKDYSQVAMKTKQTNKERRFKPQEGE